MRAQIAHWTDGEIPEGIYVGAVFEAQEDSAQTETPILGKAQVVAIDKKAKTFTVVFASNEEWEG